ncbi:MAG: hypothetical protein WBQ18_04825 [Solirubrobacteraceae bacterium]
MAAIIDLNHHASYVTWHFFSMSVSNLVVIFLMIIVFAAAILAPFPGHNRKTGGNP